MDAKREKEGGGSIRPHQVATWTMGNQLDLPATSPTELAVDLPHLVQKDNLGERRDVRIRRKDAKKTTGTPKCTRNATRTWRSRRNEKRTWPIAAKRTDAGTKAN